MKEMTESKLVDEMKKVEDTEEEQSESPRGVLENPPISGSGSGSDSENSSSRTSNDLVPVPATEESSPIRRSLSAEARNNHGGSHWRNLICNIKSKSMRRFYSFPMWSGDLTFRKKLTRKLKRGDDYDDEIDCCGGDIVVPKPSWRIFSCQELAAATDDFSSEKLIGKGGHAEVYKGCLSDGKVVAVKRITKKGKNEEDRIGNFLSELGIIAHINHPNAAKLVGFSTDGGLHLLLDFSAHGSLASVLHGPCESLNWKMRLKIALGVAEGLRYLHSECPRRIIHRDITASNILLTKDYEPQISDFGLAKWLPDKWVHHVVYPIEGTFGYMAPEYFMHGIVNEKTDVFAFGVLLLELITGCRAVDSCRQSLVMWAKPLLEKNNVKDIADSSLEDSYDAGEMKRTMRIALACLNYLPSLRPYMNQVVQLLRGEEGGGQMELREKSSAGGRTVILDACDLEDYSSTTYMNDLDRHKQLVLE